MDYKVYKVFELENFNKLMEGVKVAQCMGSCPTDITSKLLLLLLIYMLTRLKISLWFRLNILLPADMRQAICSYFIQSPHLIC